jgi:hypothetical protein
MSRLLGLIVLLGVLAVGFLLFREPIMSALGRGPVATVEPSPELAELADQKLEQLARNGAARVALGQPELQSLLLYRYAAFLPEFVHAPEIHVDGDRLRLQARVPTERLPRLQELGPMAAFLPDTADIVLRGQVVPLPGGGSAIAIDDVSAARIPLPRRMIPPALERLGRRDQPGLPPDAVPLPMPPGAASIYVRGDSVILVGRRGSAGAP